MSRLFAAVCGLLLAAPAAADWDVPHPGAVYRVVDVAAHDVLNVRAQPGTGSEIVGGLRPDATNVTATGARQPVGGGIWWELVHAPAPRGLGWVNARFLEIVDPGAPPAGDFPLRCAGTEPFWSLDVADREAYFATPEGEGPVWDASAWRNASGLQPGHRFGIRLDSHDPPATGWATVLRAQDFCTDHMSDIMYPYDTVVVTPGGDVLAGCCARVP